MSFQSNPDIISWKINFKSPIEKVFKYISTDEGREKFWADTESNKDSIIFTFPNSFKWEGKILSNDPPDKYSLVYIDNSIVTFQLEPDGKGGTDLTMKDKGVKPEYRTEVIAGWGSVLMNMKAVIDYGVDLRNQDPTRTWDQGFFEN